jgi:hypothetical protein
MEKRRGGLHDDTTAKRMTNKPMWGNWKSLLNVIGQHAWSPRFCSRLHSSSTQPLELLMLIICLWHIYMSG